MNQDQYNEIRGARGPISPPPEYPESAGTRERFKFRHSDWPGLTLVAVSNDDGSDINAGVLSAQEETLLLLRAMVRGLSLITNVDLLGEMEYDDI